MSQKEIVGIILYFIVLCCVACCIALHEIFYWSLNSNNN